MFLTIFSSCKTGRSIFKIKRKLTKQSKQLISNLKETQNNGSYLVGHQDDLAYGVHWKYEESNSDVFQITEDYPALFGWDISKIEHDSLNNIDGVPFLKIKSFIEEAYNKGGVNTIGWHMDNPITDGNSWDISKNIVPEILPKGTYNKKYNEWLDKGVTFFKSLKGKGGKKIPILFRPFHEFSGHWFWWGNKSCTPEQYKKLWIYTHQYLASKKVKNLIYVYNANDFSSKADFLKNYPGNQYVDIISFDAYQFGNSENDSLFVEKVSGQLSLLAELGKELNKPIALAETGYEQIPSTKWFSEVINKAIGDHKIAYILFWRNHGWHEEMNKMHYYLPYKGHPAAEDFKAYYKQPNTLFLNDILSKKIYKSH